MGIAHSEEIVSDRIATEKKGAYEKKIATGKKIVSEVIVCEKNRVYVKKKKIAPGEKIISKTISRAGEIAPDGSAAGKQSVYEMKIDLRRKNPSREKTAFGKKIVAA